jgi:hypothetical protein
MVIPSCRPRRLEVRDQYRRSFRLSLASPGVLERNSPTEFVRRSNLLSMLKLHGFSTLRQRRRGPLSDCLSRLVSIHRCGREPDSVRPESKCLIRACGVRVLVGEGEMRHRPCSMIVVRAGMTARLRKFLRKSFRENLRGEATRRWRNERTRFGWLGFGTHGICA